MLEILFMLIIILLFLVVGALAVGWGIASIFIWAVRKMIAALQED